MELQVAEIFGNHMVLQQRKPVHIWGTGRAGSRISIAVQGKEAVAEAAEDGRWHTIIPELQPSEHETLKVKADTEELIFENIAVGEVWLAGGQSNMEFFMRYDKDFDETVKNCENKNIRFFDYPVLATEKMKEIKDYSEFGFWRKCDPKNLQYYSAPAYYFAKELQEALKVPVGIVRCNCGGTRSCCWMDEETIRECGQVWLEDYENGLKAIPDLKKGEEEYLANPMMDKAHPFENQISDRLMYGTSLEELQEMFAKMSDGGSGDTIGPWHEWRPAGLFHTMLKKLVPFTVKGVIWYQGESDEDHPEIYADMMCGLIRCWRREWKNDLPFIMTQLAPFGEAIGNGGKYYPIIREQQEEVTRRMDEVYCASIGDVGDEYDIHPKEKQPVGKRLALLARGHIYGEDILCEAPVVKSVERDGNKIEIQFENAGDGLVLKGRDVSALRVICDGEMMSEGTFESVLNKDRMLISLPENKAGSTVKIAFAKEAYYKVNVYNTADIPVKPFLVEI